jgi:hypothetical protein
MTTYKEIYGTNVEVLSSDPTNPVEGQIWYNSTSQTLKGYALVAGSWATAGPLNTARASLAGAGIQTSALAFGGSTPTITVSIQNLIMEQLGQLHCKFKYCKNDFQVQEHKYCSFSIWRIYNNLQLEIMKLGMDQLGQNWEI